VTGDRAISADPIENAQGRVSIARLRKENRATGRIDMIAALRARRIDIGQIDNEEIDLIQSSARCRRLR